MKEKEKAVKRKAYEDLTERHKRVRRREKELELLDISLNAALCETEDDTSSSYSFSSTNSRENVAISVNYTETNADVNSRRNVEEDYFTDNSSDITGYEHVFNHNNENICDSDCCPSENMYDGSRNYYRFDDNDQHSDNIHNNNDNNHIGAIRNGNMNHNRDADDDVGYESELEVVDHDGFFCNNIPLHDCKTLRRQLIAYFLHNNLTREEANELLVMLKQHLCFSDLPKDLRTLLSTSNLHVEVKSVPPGEYVHIGLRCIIKQALRFSNTTPNVLQIDLNTDGVKAVNCGLDQYWPIQVRITNVSYNVPMMVGIYRGPGKPQDVSQFFNTLIEEFDYIKSKGGILFRGRRIPIV